MNDLRMLRILVEDWKQKLASEETEVSLYEAAKTLGGEMYQQIKSGLPTNTVANLIDMDVREIGVRESALEMVRQYPTPEALVKERDLLGVMQDLAI